VRSMARSGRVVVAIVEREDHALKLKLLTNQYTPYIPYLS
jgi:hypothetical protein